MTVSDLARYEANESSLALEPISDVPAALARLATMRQFIRSVMVEGEDWGHIPGVAKPCLFQPGAQKLGEMYGLAASYEVDERIEDWEKGFWYYTVRCTLTSRRTGLPVGQGLGSCNSMEERYRWRESKRRCPR